MAIPMPTRARILAATAALLAACSSSDGGNTPPNGPGAPATIAILGGDGQSAAPGAVLPTALAVVVRDAAGTAVPGVVVHFAVDSGGGSVAIATVTTAPDGTASAGTWTLGAVVGAQVASATVTGAVSIKFHAMAQGPATNTLFNNTAVSAGGGTLRFSKTADPLDGLTITVPAGAYPTGSQWTVTSDPTATVPLPAGFSLAAPVLTISNTQGFADSVMTLTMPMSVATDQALAPFFYDPVSGTLEPIPLSDRTATSATLATQHFSADLMAKPSASGSAGSLRQAFGDVRIVWVRTPIVALAGTFSSGFVPGTDDWEFSNYGDYISPAGDCEGMSITAMYWHYFVKPTSGALFHRFDASTKDQWDNLQGIRFVGSVQGDFDDNYFAGHRQVSDLIKQGIAHNSHVELFTANWVLLTIKLTHQPVLITLRGNNGAHAVVAYAAKSTGSHTEVSVADPNNPGGKTSRMVFENGDLTPVSLAQSTGGAPHFYDEAYAVGVSSDLPLSKVSARYAEFRNSHAGDDRYPHSYAFEVFDELTQTWGALGATLETTNQFLNTRLNCTDCPIKAPDGSTIQGVTYWKPDGSEYLAENPLTLTASGPVMVVGYGRSPSSDANKALGFVESKTVAVTYVPFEATPAYSEPLLNTNVTFTAHPHEFGTGQATYLWTFGDGTPAINRTGDSTVSHIFTKEGDFTVTVTFRNANGKVLARRSLQVIAHVPFSVTITPSPIQAKAGQPVTLTAHAVGVKDIDHYFSWEFGGFGQNTPDTTIVPHWNNNGTYPVTVDLMNGKTHLSMASFTTTATVKTYPATWRLTSLTRVTTQAPNPGSDIRWLTGLARMDSFMDQVIHTPSDGLMFVEDNTAFTEHAFYFQATPPGEGITALYAVPGGMLTLFARTLSPGDFYTTVGPLTSGTIDGSSKVSQFVFTDGEVALVNTIHASKTATGLLGTITYELLNFGGKRTYSFVATRINP